MSIARNFYIKEVLDQVLSMMYEDLADEFEFDSEEPVYLGIPTFVANYPCLISVPTYTMSTIEAAESPYFGRTTIQHTIIYLFSGMRAHTKDFVDPAVRAIQYGQRMLDWVVYAAMMDRLPLKDPLGDNVDSNWAADQYWPPFEFSTESEYQSSLRDSKSEQNLYAPSITFNTILQERFVL